MPKIDLTARPVLSGGVVGQSGSRSAGVGVPTGPISFPPPGPSGPLLGIVSAVYASIESPRGLRLTFNAPFSLEELPTFTLSNHPTWTIAGVEWFADGTAKIFWNEGNPFVGAFLVVPANCKGFTTRKGQPIIPGSYEITAPV